MLVFQRARTRRKHTTQERRELKHNEFVFLTIGKSLIMKIHFSPFQSCTLHLLLFGRLCNAESKRRRLRQWVIDRISSLGSRMGAYENRFVTSTMPSSIPFHYLFLVVSFRKCALICCVVPSDLIPFTCVPIESSAAYQMVIEHKPITQKHLWHMKHL